MIYIALGSNLGNRLENLQKAVALIKARCIPDIQCSIILETMAIMLEGAPKAFDKPYLNMIVFGTCELTPHQLLTKLKEIEHEIGRPMTYSKWEPRVIDLDILLFGRSVVDKEDLTIPHRELKNRPFLLHLLGLLGLNNYHGNKPSLDFFQNSFMVEDLQENRSADPECTLVHEDSSTALTHKSSAEMGFEGGLFTKSLAISPKLVGVVNITTDSFSDGGLFATSAAAVTRSLEVAKEGASIVELGAQSTRPGATVIGAEAEYALLAPVIEALQGHDITISIDSFLDEVILKVLDKYNVGWINDVKGDLSDQTLTAIAQKGCSIAVMHSLAVPAQKDIRISDDIPSIVTIMDWAKAKIEHLMKCGFELNKIITDPGIGFSKSFYQDLTLLREVERMKELGCPILVGHSRKSFMQDFTPHSPSKRDIETIAISQFLHNKVDYLRVHNVKDHMRFFVAQGVMGAR